MRPTILLKKFSLPATSTGQSTEFKIEGEYLNALLITSPDLDYNGLGGSITITESGGSSENEVPIQGIPLPFFGDLTEKTFGTPIDADSVSNQIVVPLGARHTLNEILNVSLDGMANAGGTVATVQVSALTLENVPEYALKYRLSSQSEHTVNDVLEMYVQGFTPSKANLEACDVNLKYNGRTELVGLDVHHAVEMLNSKLESGASTGLNAVRIFQSINGIPTQVKYNITDLPAGSKVLVVSKYMRVDAVARSVESLQQEAVRSASKVGETNPEMATAMDYLDTLEA